MLSGNNALRERKKTKPMPVKFKVSKLEEVAEAQRSLYKPTAENGFYVLDVDGAVDADQLSEFRNNNREMMRLIGSSNITDARAKLERLKDIDPDEYARVKTELDKFKKTGQPDVETLVTQRTTEMKAEHEKTVKKITGENSTLSDRLSKVLIDDALATAAASKGILSTAIEDVKLRGRGVFKIENGEVVALAQDGKTRLYGKNSEGLTVTEWMDKLSETAPHLFEPNKGGGSGGGGTRQKYTQPNPYSKKTMNRTEQSRLEKANPALATQLQQQAASEG